LKTPRCECGYRTPDADDLFIHLAEMLVPDGDADRNGIAHAELAREESDAPLACLCGTTANTLTDLDVHLLAALFMPADEIGADGARLAPFPEDFSGREDFCRLRSRDCRNT
jgi:hypothetical protein